MHTKINLYSFQCLILVEVHQTIFYGLYTEKDKMKTIQSMTNYGDRRLGGEYLIRQLAYKLILSPGNPQIDKMEI